MLKRLRLPIAEPCHEDWDAMRGEGAGRFCDVCEKNVTNLSDMSRSQASEFLRQNAGKNVCVRYRSARDGEIRFNDPSIAAPTPTAMSGWKATLAAAGMAVMMLGGCTGDRSPDVVDSEGCTYDLGPFEFRLKRGEGSCPETSEYEYVMGAVAPPVEPDVEETMGKVAIDDPPPPVMGEAPIVEEVELMGDVEAIDPNEQEPCDGKPKPEQVSPSKPKRF